MNKLPHHSEDELLVKRRFDSHLYKIDVTEYSRIIDLIELYDDAIYYLPEHETTEVTGVDKDIEGMKVVVPIRNIMFC